jgi:uncharacterized phage-associated protein
MKLQKLCFYAQAWHLANYYVPLFDNDFEHWSDGPVCPELFKLGEGRFTIQSKDIPRDLCIADEFDEINFNALSFSAEHFGPLGGDELSAMTHRENPWKETKRNQVISKDLLTKFYEDIFNPCDNSDDIIITKEDIDNAINEAEHSTIYSNVNDLIKDLHESAGIRN